VATTRGCEREHAPKKVTEKKAEKETDEEIAISEENALTMQRGKHLLTYMCLSCAITKLGWGRGAPDSGASLPHYPGSEKWDSNSC